MQWRRLGNSPLHVSEISLGSWLTLGQSVDPATSRACIQTALDLGITCFDTADVYGDGEAERFLGTTFRDLPRETYQIASKCFFPHAGAPERRGLSRRHILFAVERSLQNLGLDTLDILYAHRFDPETPLEETIQAMDELVRQGKIRTWGISRWRAIQMAEAVYRSRELGCVPPVVHQSIYNMLHRACEAEILDGCHRLGLGFVAYSPLAQGVLTGKYQAPTVPKQSRAAHPATAQTMHALTPENLATVEALVPIARDLGCTLSQLALAWCLSRAHLSTVLIGASSPGQIAENAAACTIILSAETLDRLDRVLGNAPSDPFTGQTLPTPALVVAPFPQPV